MIGLEICFSSFIVSVSVLYSCLLLRIWSAYADCGSLCFLYRVCSVYHCCRVDRFVRCMKGCKCCKLVYTCRFFHILSCVGVGCVVVSVVWCLWFCMLFVNLCV